jgi:hypothetical protein
MTFRAFRIFNAGTGGDLVLATGYELGVSSDGGLT